MGDTEYEMNSVDAVMQMLMLIVYADGIKHQDEISEMWRRISKLRLFAEMGFFPNAGGLTVLFEKHDANMLERLKISSLSDVTEAAIMKIDNPDLISQLLPALSTIANSDAEFHEAEKQIISRALDAWDIEL